MGILNGYPNTPPQFFGRRKELDMVLELAAPCDDRRSAVILIEGPGGIGKTMLLRQAMAEVRARYPSVRCVEPLDMDDTAHRVASNTGMSIATALSEKRFSRYINANLKYQGLEAEKLDPETVRFFLTLGDQYFAADYISYAKKHRIAIFVDTIEAIRGTHIWFYFLRMMAVLPNTLFVLAGRPKSQLLNSTESLGDEIERFQHMEHIGPTNVRHRVLAGWPEAEASDFARSTELGSRLPQADLNKLLRLSRCRPLHLTLALELPRPRRLAVLESITDVELKEIPLYKGELEAPCEVDRTSPPDVTADDLSERGKKLVETFERELLLHFAGADPMAQTMRRLAHVRRRLNEAMYQQVLNFEPPIADAPTWRNLRNQPWIRRRADNFISLHDIVSELIQQHIWPIRDRDGSERRRLSRDSVQLYDVLLQEQRSTLERLDVDYDGTLQQINDRLEGTRQVIIDAVGDDLAVRLNRIHKAILETNRETWVLEAERLYYMLDVDLRRGYQDFIKGFDRASNQGQLIVREMILSEMEGFAGRFSDDSEERYQIGVRQIDAAIDDNLLTKASETVALLQRNERSDRQRYELLNWLGNIYIRMPGEANAGLSYFEQAATLAEQSESLKNRIGEALRELGWAYRQLGRWQEAAEKYREALVSTKLADRGIRAQILRNLAYVETLIGNYDEAAYFIHSSLDFRRDQHDILNLGKDLSVLGEISRYQRQFEKAHEAYDEAIGLFNEAGALGWQGLVEQEKAICLIQESAEPESIKEAQRYISSALYLCHEFSPRSYASALNRAGRIEVADIDHNQPGKRTLSDYNRAFDRFFEGLEAAQRVQDNWFEIANAIEYAELALRLWEKTGSSTYRERIFAHQDIIEAKEKDVHLGFPDLFGRWHLIKGHVAAREGVRARKVVPDRAVQQWNTALEEYGTGFSLIAKGYFGSHGIPAIPRESAKLRQHISKLPKKVALEWCEHLEEQWGRDAGKSVLLLALVEDIYREVARRKR